MLVDMKEFDIANRLHPVWAKIPAISRALDMYPHAEWIWWLDVDAIIMTPHIDLYERLLNSTQLRGLLLEGKTISTNDRVPIQKGEAISTEWVSLLRASG
jgi:hypothetical protein